MDLLALFGAVLTASLFSSGGMSNLPALKHDLLPSGLATQTDFGQAVAIGQLSPGPSGLWAVALGYLMQGWLGGALALLAITLPPLLVLPISMLYQRHQRRNWAARVLGGVSVAGMGMMLASAWTIVEADRAWSTWMIGGAALVLAATRRVNVIVVLLLAGLAGVLLYR